jgi:hypothetical protein
LGYNARQSKSGASYKHSTSGVLGVGVGNNAVDYYTVQNTRNGSIQNSSQQTSRNQNHLATQQIKINSANPLLSAD